MQLTDLQTELPHMSDHRMLSSSLQFNVAGFSAVITAAMPPFIINV